MKVPLLTAEGLVDDAAALDVLRTRDLDLDIVLDEVLAQALCKLVSTHAIYDIIAKVSTNPECSRCRGTG